MDCREIFELMNQYFDGEISDDDREKLFSHIEECENCKEDFYQLKSIIDGLRNEPLVELPEDYHKNLMAKLEKEVSNKKVINFKSFYKYAGLVAVFVFVFLGGMKAGLFERNKVEPKVASTEGEAETLEMPKVSGDEAGVQPRMMAGLTETVAEVKLKSSDKYVEVLDLAREYNGEIIESEDFAEIKFLNIDYLGFIDNLNNRDFAVINEEVSDLQIEYNNLLESKEELMAKGEDTSLVDEKIFDIENRGNFSMVKVYR